MLGIPSVLVTLLTIAAPHNAAVAGADPADGALALEAREVPLRVVSYNMHTGIGADGRLDLERTASLLADLDADVIGLEEVDVHWSARSEWKDQARELADMLDMSVYFAPIYSLDPPEADAPRREYGLAVLTELPVVDTANHEITRLSTQSRARSRHQRRASPR
jgi:endonuclease/exonuclease/phosphatase family metal-dependent hydrolase